jgi:hypothetical protein
VIERVERPAVAPAGEPCTECGAALARDQRYCLTCGARRRGLGATLAGDPPRAAAASPPSEPRAAVVAERPWRLDAGLVAGVGCLLLALLVGVLIGRSGRTTAEPRAAAAPQVLTISATPTATPTAGATAPVSFTSDWPAGKRGFTVQLQTLPKSGTDAAAVAAAKQAATGKGAKDVGALDSDEHSSLPGGRYVIYSGQYADRKAAQSALKGLKKDFPDAKVIEVATAGRTQKAATTDKTPSASESAKAINDLNSATGDDYSKKSAQLPKDLITPGKPPPKDNKPAGGGSAVQTFP